MEAKANIHRSTEVLRDYQRLFEIRADIPAEWASWAEGLELPLSKGEGHRVRERLLDYDVDRLWAVQVNTPVGWWVRQAGMVHQIRALKHYTQAHEWGAADRASERLDAGRPLWPKQHLQLEAILRDVHAYSGVRRDRRAAEARLLLAAQAGADRTERCEWVEGHVRVPLVSEVPWFYLQQDAIAWLGQHPTQFQDFAEPWLVMPMPRDLHGEELHAAVA